MIDYESLTAFMEKLSQTRCGWGKWRNMFVKGQRELILELSVGADIRNDLKIAQINNSAIICLHVWLLQLVVKYPQGRDLVSLNITSPVLR